jgi:hypothetical protein
MLAIRLPLKADDHIPPDRRVRTDFLAALDV